MPLVPIRGDESNSSMLSANQTLVSKRCLTPSVVVVQSEHGTVWTEHLVDCLSRVARPRVVTVKQKYYFNCFTEVKVRNVLQSKVKYILCYNEK